MGVPQIAPGTSPSENICQKSKSAKKSNERDVWFRDGGIEREMEFRA